MDVPFYLRGQGRFRATTPCWVPRSTTSTTCSRSWTPSHSVMVKSVPDALIGASGFVGTTLQRQTHFDALYRSTNIGQIDGLSFDVVVCAGAPAQKWLANRDPSGDRAKIDDLISH